MINPDTGQHDLNVYHCCKRCGFRPIEGMTKYMMIHGVDEAACIVCKERLYGQEDPYPEDKISVDMHTKILLKDDGAFVPRTRRT